MNKFLWGTATSSHQVEGGNFNNDWWLWEKMGKIKTQDSSHPSCDHYHLYKDDFKLIKFLNNNSYRFSIEWSRIEKEEGKFDEKEIEHYIDMLEELKKLEIEPILTLHHFTIPIWFYNKGGFLNDESPKIFARFVKKVVPYFKSYVKYWITINEPLVLAVLGYIFGWWPPGIKNFRTGLKVAKNLILSHMEAYKIIKEEDTSSQISIAHNMELFYPASNFFADKIVANYINDLYNYKILDSLIEGVIKKPFGNDETISDLKNSLDFIGVNFYTRAFVKFHPFKIFSEKKRKGVILTDFGYEYYPEGIYEILINLKKYNKKILITEHGIADREDKLRKDFLIKAIESLKKAINEGVEVFGYTYWSLMDNFEWIEGYSMRFGLFEVDFNTLERKPRESAFLYKDLCSKGI
ncbi:MAG: family 1 glycosylhydrolase [Caldisericia bacterium]|nr:family 1 glycosylhydrolase [Caldisericia bacterium]